ncbi:class I SAM-dependent methyltransferase [Brevibacterium gallinarum]|uniref:Methyltransferase domain-containing protein n=1 Tax=Brevibacterium gallinarum TaxID=2762220 RepID=A0ABR8WTL5_9MICO|nr:class I SAM-dependent methyltransferase [Brevibacterium gallinarum]MBD8020420.1 hypothetical protein [Brevibacterium gallinarum]
MDDTWFAGVAEYHELFMGAAWQRLMTHIEPAVAEAVGTSAGPIVEFGAGSGIGTTHLHERFPHADLIACEPDAIMRTVLFGRPGAGARMRERVTVVPLPVAGEHAAELRAQLPAPGSVPVILVAHVLGILDAEARALLWQLIAETLSPAGIALITAGSPHTDDPEDADAQAAADPPKVFTEDITVGAHTITGEYRRENGHMQVTYTQRDAAGGLLRQVSTPPREIAAPLTIEDYRREAAACGLQSQVVSGYILKLSRQPR